MIKVEKGKVEIMGEMPRIRSELATLIHALHFNVIEPQIGEEESRKIIMETVEDGFKTAEQIMSEKPKERFVVCEGELSDLVSSIFEHIMEKKGGAKNDL